MDNNHKNDIRKLLELADTNEKIITYDVCGENIIIKVKPYISLEERCNLIENAVELCFTNDGEHLPFIIGFAWKYEIIKAYTDIEPLDAETFWAIITKTDFFEQVLNKISDDTCSLLSDIHETIKYKRQKNGNVFSGLLNKISNISDKIKDIDIPKLFDLAESISNKDEAKIVDEILELKNNSEKQNVEE